MNSVSNDYSLESERSQSLTAGSVVLKDDFAGVSHNTEQMVPCCILQNIDVVYFVFTLSHYIMSAKEHSDTLMDCTIATPTVTQCSQSHS